LDITFLLGLFLNFNFKSGPWSQLERGENTDEEDVKGCGERSGDCSVSDGLEKGRFPPQCWRSRESKPILLSVSIPRTRRRRGRRRRRSDKLEVIVFGFGRVQSSVFSTLEYVVAGNMS